MTVYYRVNFFLFFLQSIYLVDCLFEKLIKLKDEKNHIIGILMFQIGNETENIFLNYEKCNTFSIKCNDYQSNLETKNLFICDEYKGNNQFYYLNFIYKFWIC